MKRAILIAFAVSTMAGVAGAQMLKPAPVAGIPMPASNDSIARAKPDSVRQEGAPTRISSAGVAKRAPVPMQFAPRVPVAARNTAESGTARPEADRVEAAPIQAMEGLSDRSARAAIEADGYKHVRVLSRSETGTWLALALRGKSEVTLRVDAQGTVMAD